MGKMPAWLKRECGGRVARADGGSTPSRFRRMDYKYGRDANPPASSADVPDIAKAAMVGAGLGAIVPVASKAFGNALGNERAVDGKEDRKDGGSVKKNWVKGAIKKPGALHKALGVPQGEKIPAKKLDKAAHSENPTMRKRANLAKTLKGFK